MNRSGGVSESSSAVIQTVQTSAVQVGYSPTGPVQPPPSAAPLPNDDSDLALRLAQLKEKRRVIRRILKGERIQAAGALISLIETALKEKTATAWARLLLYPFMALYIPKTAVNPENNVKLTTKIKRQICSNMDYVTILDPVTTVIESESQNGAHHSKPNRRLPPEKSGQILRRRVADRLPDGSVQGAIRLLDSSDEIAQNRTEGIKILRLKYPSAPAHLHLPSPPDETSPCLAAEAEVVFSIASFVTGSSAGLDGLQPAHLKDLTSQ